SQAHAADDTFCWRTTPQRGDKVLDDGSRARITSLDNLTVQLRRVAATFRPTGQDVVAVGVEDARPSASWLGLRTVGFIEVLAHRPAIDSQTVSHCPDGLCLFIEVVDLVIAGLSRCCRCRRSASLRVSRSLSSVVRGSFAKGSVFSTRMGGMERPTSTRSATSPRLRSKCQRSATCTA